LPERVARSAKNESDASVLYGVNISKRQKRQLTKKGREATSISSGDVRSVYVGGLQLPGDQKTRMRNTGGEENR